MELMTELIEKYQALVDDFEKRGCFEQALAYHKKLLEVKEKYYKDKTEKDLKELYEKYMTEATKREAEIYILRNVALEQEINVRKQVEEELRKFSRAVEQCGSAVIITNLQGMIEFVNPAFSKITGYSAEEAIGQTPRILKSERHSPELYHQLWDTISRGDIWQGELLNKKKNGDMFWEQVTISPIKDKQGTMTHYLAIKDDITRRKQAEAALQASEARYRQMFEKHASIQLLLDPKTGVIIDANPAAATFYGYALSKLKQMKITEINTLPPEEAMSKMMQAVAQQYGQFHFRHRLASGEIRDVEVHAGPVMLKEQSLLYLIIQDITERKQTEEALHLALDELEDRVAELSTLNHIIQTLTIVTDLQSALEMVAATMVQLFNAQCSNIALLDERRITITIVAHVGQVKQSDLVGMMMVLQDHPVFLKVVESKQSLVIPHAQTNPLVASLWDIIRQHEMQCLMIVPLLARGEVIGTIGVDIGHHNREITESEVKLAETIAGQIAGVIDNARLFSDEQRQRQIAESLRQVTMILNSSLEQDAVVTKILAQLRQVIQYDSAELYLQSGDELTLTAGVGIDDIYRDYHIPLSSSLRVAQVYREQRPFVKLEKRTGLVHNHKATDKPTKSWMAAPLMVGQSPIGVLTVESLEAIAYDDRDAQILQLFANQAAIAIENAHLFEAQQTALEQAEILAIKNAQLLEEQQRANDVLKETLQQLEEAQSQLVEAEKMASLGSLVAGVAHEINTPIGVAITASSTLADNTRKTSQLYKQQKLKGSELTRYLDQANRSCDLMLINLERAGELIKSFKQVAVDQTHEEIRNFTVKNYIEYVLVNLRPRLKQTHHQMIVAGDENISITSYPGAFFQIVTNLVINSLTHAYKKDEAGTLQFTIQKQPATFKQPPKLLLTYQDDGCGVAPENLDKIFDPFFTTGREKGGTGLGLHIVYNLVTQKLKGTIQCESNVGQGVKFILSLPLEHTHGTPS